MITLAVVAGADSLPTASKTNLEERLDAFRRAQPYREIDVDGRYDRKLWIGDFLKSVVYLPSE